MMIALGLLAQHDHLRPEVLPSDLNDRLDFGKARIAAFNGRNNPDNYIWGGNRHPAWRGRSHQAVLGFWSESGGSEKVERDHR
ncbi:MAG: hypothetical protein AB2544_17435 [Candidatus Thiodiazotropha endolucinida]